MKKLLHDKVVKARAHALTSPKTACWGNMLILSWKFFIIDCRKRVFSTCPWNTTMKLENCTRVDTAAFGPLVVASNMFRLEPQLLISSFLAIIVKPNDLPVPRHSISLATKVFSYCISVFELPTWWYLAGCLKEVRHEDWYPQRGWSSWLWHRLNTARVPGSIPGPCNGFIFFAKSSFWYCRCLILIKQILCTL